MPGLRSRETTTHQTHDQIGAYAAAALLPASYAVLTLALDEPPAAAYSGALVVICAHLWATWVLSPDLDIDSAIYDRWGPFRWLWLPYQKIIPHRSWFSHSGISGALRLLYLGGALWCALYLLGELGRVVFGLAGVPAYHEQFFAWLIPIRCLNRKEREVRRASAEAQHDAW
jgi:uncharacterized metal-binding protein